MTAAPTAPPPGSRTPAGPLSGVRVLEFTTAWAGPFAGRCLAYLGADVIKVEAPGHPDSWRGTRRGGAPIYYPESEPGEDPQNRSVLFNSQNLDKRSLALDLKQAGAMDVMHDLVRRSDVLLANFTPGVLDRLGIGRRDLARVNDRIIVVEMPAFGPGGPSSSHQGMGKTMEPAAGMTSLMGYPDGMPVLTGPALMDPVGGLNAVAAVVSALELRERTGRGSQVLVPQVEAAASWIGEYILEQVETGSTWAPDGNHVPYAAPHGAYPCAGEDEWVAIAVRDDRQWRALCTTLGAHGLADDPAFRRLDDRRSAQELIDAVLAELTREHDKAVLAERLQAAGVPAAPVLGGDEIAESPAMRECGMVVDLDHAAVGRRAYSALAFRHSRTPGSHRRAAPLFGEHNDEVLRDLLGYDAGRVAALRGAGAVADAPAADTDTPHVPRADPAPARTAREETSR
ncbi:Crotonobetainyl-CoA:carnitine CoA-transferase CaiB [Actinomadura meyerae]|uniref:Crotonobetainyl-CoA:carnitine CoA-transferase CaiB n=1 Tax=Actinomadura meyerae TaxID=240840 RepID=A0A239NUH1_9ACTN|nr:CoA transferase [Actinomadura meyerae]SNT58506.1 Crotonobetainyl-CoA:carnitine CoA-transferase CaiB [Actinomadura meyerae]